MSTTYRYKSDKANSEAVYKFFAFGFLSSFGVVVPAAIYIILLNINHCGYIGYRAAVVLLPVVQIASWLLISLRMCAVYSMMVRDDPPTPPKEHTRKERKLSFSRGSKKGYMTWEE
jgi:hypothetical protein